jgi:signal transduction histidine kinase
VNTTELTSILTSVLSGGIVAVAIVGLLQSAQSRRASLHERQIANMLLSRAQSASETSEQVYLLRRLIDEFESLRSFQAYTDDNLRHQGQSGISVRYLRSISDDVEQLSEYVREEFARLAGDYHLSQTSVREVDDLLDSYRRMSLEFSHSIKTPLATIETALSALSSDSIESGSQVDSLAPDRKVLILHSLENAQVAIASVKDIVRTGAGFLPDDPSSFTLSDLCQKAIRMTRDLNGLGTPINVHINEQFDIKFYQLNLLIALIQLIENALECPSSRPEISLRAMTDGAKVMLDVANAGPGISLDLQERVFEAEFSTKGAGRGMGLYLARECMRRVGGDLDLKHTSESETVYRISFTQIEN